MYICGVCEIQVGPRVPCNITPVETREKVYPARSGANDPGGRGFETVREVHACPSCAKE